MSVQTTIGQKGGRKHGYRRNVPNARQTAGRASLDEYAVTEACRVAKNAPRKGSTALGTDEVSNGPMLLQFVGD